MKRGGQKFNYRLAGHHARVLESAGLVPTCLPNFQEFFCDLVRRLHEFRVVMDRASSVFP